MLWLVFFLSAKPILGCRIWLSLLFGGSIFLSSSLSFINISFNQKPVPWSRVNQHPQSVAAYPRRQRLTDLGCAATFQHCKKQQQFKYHLLPTLTACRGQRYVGISWICVPFKRPENQFLVILAKCVLSLAGEPVGAGWKMLHKAMRFYSFYK